MGVDRDFRHPRGYRSPLWKHYYYDSYIYGILFMIICIIAGFIAFILLFNFKTTATVTSLYGNPLQKFYFEYTASGKVYNGYSDDIYYYSMQVGDEINVYVNPFFRGIYFMHDTKFIAIIVLVFSWGLGIPLLVFYIKKYNKQKNEPVGDRRVYLGDNKGYDGVMSKEDRSSFAKKNHWDEDE
jgi:hypothetical protein